MTGTTIRFVLVSTLAMILIMSLVSPNVIAAGNTDVELSPESDTITTGSTTEVDIVVTNATGGVGAVNVTVSLTPGDAATITDTSLDDSAYSVKTQTDTDNTSVTVVGFGLDTIDSGSVVVGDLTVRGDTAETTDISLQVNGLGDESGSDYTINSADRTSISVTSSSEGGSGDDETPTTEEPKTSEEPTTPTTTEEPTTSTTAEGPTISPTTVAQTSRSQAPGFGLLVTVLTFTGTVVLLFIRISNGPRSERR